MRFEIVNPSDPYTMEAPDLEVAAVACCLLGNGKYMLTGLDDAAGQDVPAFVFGGHDEWFVSKFGANYEAVACRVLDERGAELADALNSIPRLRERRTSLNDIGSKAHAIAAAIRTRAAIDAKKG